MNLKTNNVFLQRMLYTINAATKTLYADTKNIEHYNEIKTIEHSDNEHTVEFSQKIINIE